MSSMDSNCWMEKRLHCYSVLRSSGTFPGSLVQVHALVLTQLHIQMKHTSRTSHRWSWMRTYRAGVSSRPRAQFRCLWCRFLHVMYVLNVQKIQWMQSIGLGDEFCILLDYILSFHWPFQEQAVYHTQLFLEVLMTPRWSLPLCQFSPAPFVGNTSQVCLGCNCQRLRVLLQKSHEY